MLKFSISLMEDGFLQNGFYLTRLDISKYSYNLATPLKGGDSLKGKNQPFSITYDYLTVLAIDKKITGNTKGLVGIVERTPITDFVFPTFPNTVVSPKTVSEFYQELAGADNFDFSIRYQSTDIKALAPFLGGVAQRLVDSKALAIGSGNVFKVVSVEVDTGSTTVKLEDLAKFHFNGTDYTLKILKIGLVVAGVAQYDHNDWDNFKST